MIDMSEKENIEDFLESTKDDFAEPQYTDKEVILTLKPETVTDRAKFECINKRARALGATFRVSPRPGFHIPLPKPSTSTLVVPACGVLLHYEKADEYGVVGEDGKIAVIKRCEDESMTLLTDVGNLPTSVQQFIAKLAPNTVAVFDAHGTIYIEVTMSLLKTMQTLKAFLSFYRVLLAEFPMLTNYVELNEKSVPARSTYKEVVTHVWMPSHFYVVIRVKEMTLERLRFFFKPDEDFPVPNAISYLLAQGMSDSTLQSVFGIPPRTYGRYKEKINADGKTPTLKQPQTSAIGNLPS